MALPPLCLLPQHFPRDAPPGKKYLRPATFSRAKRLRLRLLLRLRLRLLLRLLCFCLCSCSYPSVFRVPHPSRSLRRVGAVAVTVGLQLPLQSPFQLPLQLPLQSPLPPASVFIVIPSEARPLRRRGTSPRFIPTTPPPRSHAHILTRKNPSAAGATQFSPARKGRVKIGAQRLPPSLANRVAFQTPFAPAFLIKRRASRPLQNPPNRRHHLLEPR